MKKISIRIFRILVKPFLGKKLGRNYLVRKIMGILIWALNPVIAADGSRIYIPSVGIDYIIEPYEEFNLKLLKNNLKKGNIFLDIGAGVGYFTVIASKIVGEEGKVIAFEPTPEYLNYLKKNFKENNCQNIELIQKAVSNKNGKTKLYLYQDRIGSNRIADVAPFIKAGPTIEVETVRMDDFYKGRVDFIKIDAEGSEFLILEGMKEMLGQNKNVKMLIEMPDFKARECLELLNNSQFKIYEISQKDDRLALIDDFNKILARKETCYLFCER